MNLMMMLHFAVHLEDGLDLEDEVEGQVGVVVRAAVVLHFVLLRARGDDLNLKIGRVNFRNSGSRVRISQSWCT
jgi:hypothetical protein